MSEYIFFVGDDYKCSNKEYVALPTDKGQQITVTLTASVVPFKGRFDKSGIFFDYDSDYKESVDEIIAKFTSDEYAEQRKEIEEHRGDDCLYFLPTVANILRMTVGTLRNRPEDIQLTLCKHYTDVWLCDEDTIKRELEDVLMLRMKTF